jgi:hypothetical protein
MWGRMASCGRLAIGLVGAEFLPLETFPLWSTIARVNAFSLPDKRVRKSANTARMSAYATPARIPDMRHCAVLTLLALISTGCSSSSQSKSATATPTGQRVPASSNPVGKYIEVSGFRINEKRPGTLSVQFAVTNHSDADIGNIVMQVNLRSTTAKPDDPPIATFSARVDALGPQELKEVKAEFQTKLRPYELPDWQFLTADFQITEPK